MESVYLTNSSNSQPCFSLARNVTLDRPSLEWKWHLQRKEVLERVSNRFLKLSYRHFERVILDHLIARAVVRVVYRMQALTPRDFFRSEISLDLRVCVIDGFDAEVYQISCGRHVSVLRLDAFVREELDDRRVFW